MVRFPLVLVVALSLIGCYGMHSNGGGADTKFSPPRTINPADIALPAGYRIEAVASGLTFPTGIALDDNDTPYVTEAGYSYGEVWTVPRLLRLERDGSKSTVAAGEGNGPWNGLAYANAALYVAEGGELEGGRILRFTKEGRRTVLVDQLPSLGDHHTNGPAIGPDGKIYFGQGTATNSGVVGPDNFQFGWLKRNPRFHDTPCRDVTLAGRNFESEDPLTGKERVTTGAYVPFGTSTEKGQVIKGSVPCNGAILRVSADGGRPELVAWGLRNPYGLAFSPDGRLFVTENGYDDRGSRPAWGTPDVMWEVKEGGWFGWPDFSAGRPLSNAEFQPPGKGSVPLLLAEPPAQPPRPAAVLGVHSSSNGFDFSRSSAFGYQGEAFVAQLGDESPTTGKVLHPVGFKVVRVDVKRGTIEDFAVNRGTHQGPASFLKSGGLERPIAVRFNRGGSALYVVDFGVMVQDEQGAHPVPGTGVVWRITRDGAS